MIEVFPALRSISSHVRVKASDARIPVQNRVMTRRRAQIVRGLASGVLQLNDGVTVNSGKYGDAIAQGLANGELILNDGTLSETDATA